MKKYIIRFLIIISIILAYVLIFGFLIEPYKFKTNEMKITKANIDKWDGFKIVHLSDIHYLKTLNNDMLNKVIKEVNLINPDIVILSGDLLNKDISYTNDDLKFLEEALKTIKTKLGKYIIKGDNDTIEEWSSLVTNSDFIDITNTYEYLFKDDNMPILISNKMDEEYKIDTCFKIFVIHKADDIENMDYKYYDLILAGHSLGGINLPLIGRVNLPMGSKKYSYGVYELDNTTLIVSNGLGTNETKFRFMNTPSINFYRIVK